MYGSWGWNKGKGGKTWSSTSGWEKSHFGGFNRIIWDYPHIKLDFKANIEIPNELRIKHGIYTSEKLIKMYLIKCKEFGYLGHFKREVIVKKNIIGREKKFECLKLDNRDVLEAVMAKSREFAPLFNHYREDILASSLEIEIQEGGSGGGKGSGKGEKEESKEKQNSKGKGKGEENQEDGDEDQGEGEGENDSDNDSDSKENDGDGNGGESPSEKGGGWGGSDSDSPDFKELERILDEMSEQKPFSNYGTLGSGDSNPRFVVFDESEIKGEYNFTAQERSNADMILKQLDISFDPKSDEVKNLKLGKLDTSKLAEVPAGNISVYKQTLEDQDTKPFAVCVLADMSGSMQGERLDTQLKVLNSLYLALSEIIPVEDLHIYGHSGSGREPLIYTFCSPYSPNYAKNIKKYYSISNSSNYDGIVIEKVHKKIREKTENPVILISLSDGQPCDDIEAMKQILERARRDQFVTVGIGIGTDYVKHLYTYSRVVSDQKLKEMPREVSGIVNHVVKNEFK